MAEDYLERVAGELADLALADEQRTKDENIINEISGILGSSSQTLQEGFLTAVRVRRAEVRARALLAERSRGPQRVKSRLLIDDAEEVTAPDDTHIEDAEELSIAPEPQPQEPAEEDAFADVLSTLDEFLQEDEEKPIAPSRPSRK
ncbi:hypothetical protein MWU60_02090 [Yoonia sp. F2084L]|uniref:hypothetical protein n=1 Tax=Yoonia sp. F2084L TaxID=2926419 RepID=UPI001FF1D9C7|nr:hypothetical protein [Yoonia sp. F2084L]MCK0094347.1 hypothetical protein [Yoonia sp. F2084L]